MGLWTWQKVLHNSFKLVFISEHDKHEVIGQEVSPFQLRFDSLGGAGALFSKSCWSKTAALITLRYVGIGVAEF